MEYMNRQKSTFRISFYVRRTRPNKHGEVPVCVRITVNGQRADTTIRKSILPDQWDAIRGQASPRTTLGKAINLYIDTVRARIIRIHRDLEMDEQPFTAQQVLDLYLGRKTTNRHTLFELFREHNDKCHQLVGIDLAAATAERYETCMKLTQEFMRHTYHRDDLYLDEVDRRFVEEFEFYLKTHRGCCHNTATKYLKNFKKITHIPEHHPKEQACQDAVARREAVYPVDQVDGIDDAHGRKDRQRNGHPLRNLIEAPQSVKVIQGISSDENQQQNRADLDQEPQGRRKIEDVIHRAGIKHNHHRDDDDEELGAVAGYTGTAQPDDQSEEDGNTAQNGSRPTLQFAGIRIVDDVLVEGDPHQTRMDPMDAQNSDQKREDV